MSFKAFVIEKTMTKFHLELKHDSNQCFLREK